MDSSLSAEGGRVGGREGGGWEGGRAVDEEREKEGVWGVEATKPAGCERTKTAIYHLIKKL